MPYQISFKNKNTKNKWIRNVNIFKTKKEAESTAQWIRQQYANPDHTGGKTYCRIFKVSDPKKAKTVRRESK